MSSYIDPRAKILHHMDRLHALQKGAIAPPVNVEIDLSNRCSLGCEWCHFAYTHTRGPLAGKPSTFKPAQSTPGGDLMQTGLALSIIDQLADAGVRSISWTGGGEPTLHPEFDTIIEYAHQRIEQGIYTNGAHIDTKRAALLKRSMTWVYVSLDAASQEAYRKCKGVDAFFKVCSGVTNLVNAIGDATVGVGMLLTRDNWKDYRAMADLALDLGADYVQFRPTVLPGEDTGWMAEAIVDLMSIQGRSGVELDLNRFVMYRDWQGHGYATCYWSAMQTVITPNGKCWTCVNKREFDGAEIGDLSMQSFYEIWRSHKAVAVDHDCRMMCRGHIPNLVLNEVMTPREHGNFI